MITIFVYTRNDEKTIAWCLSSLKKQDTNTKYEVLVIDDGSSDNTAAIVRKEFPEFNLIQQPRTRGWMITLREHLSEIKGDIVAFLAAHCYAKENWLSNIEGFFKEGIDVVSGTSTHDSSKFWDHFHSIVMPTYFSKGQFTELLWEDNFAISSDLLKRKGLLDTDIVISAGTGTIILAKRLKSFGHSLYFRPSMIIDHVLNTFGILVHAWWMVLPRNAITSRRIIPSIPGAKLLWSGPLAAAAIAGVRFIETALRVIRTRRARGHSIFVTGTAIFVLACFMPVYFCGLIREIVFPIK